ncbi:MAG: hypothetical protein IT441_03975 [Phycisphaeraceae bacterium]|nr:hypothetical protein [Phycisphaeraceae bacterium]
MTNIRRPNQGSTVSDKDLLAKAIPIEDLEKESAPPPPDSLEPMDLAAPSANEADKPQIKHFGAVHRHAGEQWKRQPVITGKGACHMRTFFSKLRPDALEHMDRQINEWLEQHPEYEVKFSTTTTGLLHEKTAEPAIFVTIWV